MFLLNLVLAFAWLALRGRMTTLDFAIGFVLGFLVLALSGRFVGSPHYARRAWRAVSFAAFFLVELVRANLWLAAEILRPGLRLRPGIVAVPLDVTSDAEILLLSSLVTLTPGTLSLDVSPDRRTLYVHALAVDDADAFRRQIKQGFERRVKELWS